jgi:hypothetical protein
MRNEMSTSAVLLRLGYLEAGVAFLDLNTGTGGKKKINK